jgi:hypothetical protein
MTMEQRLLEHAKIVFALKPGEVSPPCPKCGKTDTTKSIHTHDLDSIFGF